MNNEGSTNLILAHVWMVGQSNRTRFRSSVLQTIVADQRGLLKVLGGSYEHVRNMLV